MVAPSEVGGPKLFSVRASMVSFPDGVDVPRRSVSPVPLMVPPDHVIVLVTVTVATPVSVPALNAKLPLLKMLLPPH